MKKNIKVLIVILVMLVFGCKNVDAIPETKPGVPALVGKYASDFFVIIRCMETQGNAFGLNATYVIENGTYKETSTSNNIDVHMIKNTEWGIVAMMSASDYGAGNGNVTMVYNSSTNIYNVTASTTGNMSGIFGMYKGLASIEYVSGGIVQNMKYGTAMKNAEARYVDKYADSTDSSDFSRYIPGDATFETKKFTGGGGFFADAGHPVFGRGQSGIFHSNEESGILSAAVRFAFCSLV